MTIQTIHFVAGLGAAAGKPLSEPDMLAIRLAAKHHPQAELFLHTGYDCDSCFNYREALPRLRRVRHDQSVYQYANWPAASGAHQADLLRLHVLTTCVADNALYLDTDAYCIRSLNWLSTIEGCAMARLSPFMVANGLIYAGRNRQFLVDLLHRMRIAPPERCTGVRLSCQLPAELPGLTVLDNASFHGATGDQAMQGFWLAPGDRAELQAMLDSSYAIHTMSPRPSIAQRPGTNYDLLLEILCKSI